MYLALQRLELLGLIRTTGEQRTSQGPARSLLEATPAGRAAAQAWLNTPVEHARDVRSELMVKLALLDRTGSDSQVLVQAQLARLLPVAAVLLVGSFFAPGGATAAGWTLYAPLSTQMGPGMDFAIFAIHLMGASSIMGGILLSARVGTSTSNQTIPLKAPE